MASTTYINLTNQLLRRLNEVEITQANFPSTVGIQTFAKDAINAALRTINSHHLYWPFNAVSTTQVLTAGTLEYAFPTDFKIVDWQSFYIQKDDTLGNTSRHLNFVDRKYWEQTAKVLDLDAGTEGRSIPDYVFKGHTLGFGVTPSPDAAYTVMFNYWKTPADLAYFGDLPTVPTQFDEVIIQHALYHFYMFRDNIPEAQEAKVMADSLLSQMRTVLINSDDTMRSGFITRPLSPRTNAISGDLVDYYG